MRNEWWWSSLRIRRLSRPSSLALAGWLPDGAVSHSWFVFFRHRLVFSRGRSLGKATLARPSSLVLAGWLPDGAILHPWFCFARHKLCFLGVAVQEGGKSRGRGWGGSLGQRDLYALFLYLQRRIWHKPGWTAAAPIQTSLQHILEHLDLLHDA